MANICLRMVTSAFQLASRRVVGNFRNHQSSHGAGDAEQLSSLSILGDVLSAVGPEGCSLQMVVLQSNARRRIS